MKSKTTRPLFLMRGSIAFILISLLSLSLANAQDCTVVTADGVQDTNNPAHQWKVELYQGYFGVEGTLTEPGYPNAYSEHLDHVSGGDAPGAFGAPILREEAFTDLAALPFAYADENIPTSDNPFDSAFFDSRADIGTGFDPVIANGGWQMMITRTATAINDITIGLPGSYIDDHVELFVDGVLIDDIIGYRPSLAAVDVITYTTAPGEVIEIRLTNREGPGGFNLHIVSPSLDFDNNAVPDACQTDDFDLDGIPDSADLDNDNDGILDTIECAGNTSTANMTGDIIDSDTGNYPLTITGNGVSGGPTAGGVFLTNVNLSTTLNGGDLYDGCEFIILSDDFDDGFQAVVDSTPVLYFDQSNWDNTFGAATTEFNTGGLFDSDASGRWEPWIGEGNPQLLLRSNGEVVLMVDTKAGIRLNALPYMDSGSAGWVLNTSLSFDCLSGVAISAGNANDNGDGQATNIIFSANVFVCPDADGDGISNGRDNDSDEDGCPDALEGAGSFDASDLDANDRFTGGVDDQGIPNSTTGGQASTAAVTDSGDSSACAFPDSDNDGLDDTTDLDDDNDGILDSVEGTVDSDNDGVSDSLDLDSDNDGIADVIEAGGMDVDNDGRADDDDDNVDNTGSNGIPTSAGSGTTPIETTAGTPDYLNLDSDGDGCSDANEAYVDSNADGSDTGVYGPDPASVDGNGLVTLASYDTGRVAAVTDAGDFSACLPPGTADSDNDGITDNVDIDDDNDGILDTEEGIGDTDGDGVPDYLDLDSDNDGVPDITEAGGTDTDGDGQVDYPTPGDSMSMVDTNDDGLDDGVAANPLPDLDSDLDGLKDRLDLDSDNDGIPDVIEAGGTDDDGDGIIDAFTDTDDDGLSDNVDPVGPATVGTPLPHEDTDGDGVNDRLDLDSDNDGITDVTEAGGSDTDGNGRIDGFADADIDGFSDSIDTDDSTTPAVLDGTGTALPRPNFDNDTRPNYLDIDSDGDGITDATESTNLVGEDANGDGEIDNFLDANVDGFNDDTAANPITINNQDGTGGPDYIDIDNDDDGIVDNIEGQSTAGYIPPLNLDSDNDGIDDAYDTATGGTGIAPVQTAGNGPDYLVRDTDGDGLDDSIEGWDVDADGTPEITPFGTDADGDGLDDAFDNDDLTPDPTNGQVPTDFPDAQVPGGDRDWREPLDLDSDGDGVTDTQEIADGTDPNNPCDFVIASIMVEQTGDYMMADCDGDGVQNWAEIRDGTNPEDPCDFIPASVSEEPSGDYLISDCDGDGVTNGTELTDGTDPADPCSFNETSVTLDRTGDYLASDCDGDTIPNGQEIIDGTNPNDPCSSRGGVPPAGITCDIIIDNELVGPQVDAGFFRVGNIEAFPNNTVRIYNRWGILVYETTGYDNGSNNFRGFSEGRATISEDKALPVGVYFYIIDFMNDGANTSRSGYLYVNN